MTFTTRPRIDILDDGEFVLADNFKFRFPWDESQFVLIPKGYRTNFASIPGPLRAFISPIDPDIVTASVVHDWLVQEFGERQNTMHPCIYSDADGLKKVIDTRIDWNQAATIMRKIMKHEKASRFKRALVYNSVRLHGKLQGKE